MPSNGRIYFSPSPQLLAYLQELKRMGIYGKKRGDVVNHILGDEVMRLVEKRILKRLPADQEATDEDDD